MRGAALALLLALPARAQVKDPGTFVYALVGEVDTLDPQWEYDGVSHFAVDQVYEPLIGFKGPSVTAFEPLLASRVPSRANGLISRDGRTYTFPIRKGVRFHDGSPLTAEDARWSLLRAMLMDRSGGHSWLFLDPILGLQSARGADGKPLPGLYERAAKAVRVEGDSVKVTLRRPFAPFLSVLAAYGYVASKPCAVRAGAWDGGAGTWQSRLDPPKQSAALYRTDCGSGPFSLQRWDQQDQELVLARAEGYWRRPASLARVVIRTVDEFSARKLMLESGDADAISVDRGTLPLLEHDPGVRVQDGLPLMEVHDAFMFGLRVTTAGNPLTGSGRLDGEGIPPDFFADRDVRLGFAEAFPYRRYIADVYRGKGRRAIGPLPMGLLGYDPKAPLLPEDPRDAAARLRRARGGEVWKEGFRLACVYQEGKEARAQACAILKSVLEAMNPRFRVDVRGLQWSTMLALEDQRKVPL
ncbi:MAG: ABC transporter substrate-binding protein, partial [Elusimicrobia bacterium]|nr:ABC transporter substrate-binding protein [Elusimicrobiota bacterium]